MENKDIIEAWDSCYRGLLKICVLKEDLQAKTIQDYLKVLLALGILLKKCDLTEICCRQFSTFIKKTRN